MVLFEYFGSDRREITQLDLSDGRPVLLHLGDHLRVRDLYIDAKFHDYLERMKGSFNARIIAPVIYNSSQDELLGRRMIFNRVSGAPSDFARDIYNAIYHPLVETCVDFDDNAQVASLKKKLSRISISAYSYGTSLVQQMAHIMTGDVASRFAPNDPDKGAKANDICRSVKALSLGCTSRLRKIEINGDTSPLRWDDPDFASSPTAFSQTLFQMRHDRAIINALNSDEAVGGLTTSETGIELRSTRTAVQIIDYTPPPTIKRVGFSETDEGRIDAKILRLVDELVHGDSSYTYMHERQGDYVSSQTLAMTPVVRAASRAMLDPELDGSDWVNMVKSIVANDDLRRALVAGRDASACEIDLVLSEADASCDLRRGEMLRDYANGRYSEAVAQARATLTSAFSKSADHVSNLLEPVTALSPALRAELAHIVEHGLGRVNASLPLPQVGL